MPQSRKRKKKTPVQRPVTANFSIMPLIRSKKTGRQILTTWYGRVVAAVAGLATLTSLILFADWLLDQYSRSFPNVSLNSANSNTGSPILFNVGNTSRYFDMYKVLLICTVHDDTFINKEGGKLRFTGPLESGVQAREETIIIAGGGVVFPCDPALIETPPVVGEGEVMKRLRSEIYVSAKYEINMLMWRRQIQYASPYFYCYYYISGVRCYDHKIMAVDLPIYRDWPP